MDLRYLFHNIYGDANDLIANAPVDVATIAFGWDEQTENFRNQKLEELNVSGVSVLPALLFFYQDSWHEIRVADMPKPWNWEQIDEQIILKKSELDGV